MGEQGRHITGGIPESGPGIHMESEIGCRNRTQTGLREHDGTEEAAGMREDSVNTDTPQAEDPPARFLLWLL